MSGLLIKDLQLFRTQKNFYICLAIVGVMMMLTSTDPGFVVGYISLLLPTFVLNTISFDEADNGNAFLFSLPVTRRDYVKEKYIFAAICSLVTFLFVAAASSVYQIVTVADFQLMDWLLTTAMTMCIMFLAILLLLPLQIKFGSEKSRAVMLGVTFGIVAVAYLAGRGITEMGVDMERLLGQLAGLNPGIIAAAAVIVLIAVTWISMMISTKIVEKKEF